MAKASPHSAVWPECTFVQSSGPCLNLKVICLSLKKYLQGQLDYLQTVNCPLIFIPYTTIPIILKIHTYVICTYLESRYLE